MNVGELRDACGVWHVSVFGTVETSNRKKRDRDPSFDRLRMELPKRVRKAFLRRGIDTMEKLLATSANEFLETRNMGEVSLKRLLSVLDYYGLSLSE